MIDKLVLGLLLILLALAVGEANAGEYVGVNTVSRHFTADHERYCEQNWGAFYEHRWTPEKGVQVGYYRNSWCKLETADRIDDTFYGLYIYQPWNWQSVRLGGFGGLATGYKKGYVVFIGGAMATWEVTRDVSVQAIANPAVIGLQIKLAVR